MNITDLSALINTSHETCLTIIQPFYQDWANMKENKVLIRQALGAVQENIQKDTGIDGAKASMLYDKLANLADTIDYNLVCEGVGLYVSQRISKLEVFHFEVKPQVLVGPDFYLRPMIFEAVAARPYQVALLSKTSFRLYRGALKQLEEVKDADFPMEYTDTYEYYKPSVNSDYSYSQKGGQEKSVTEAHHLFQFYRSAGHMLEKKSGDDLPLIITGVDECIDVYKKAMGPSGRILAAIRGNYEHAGIRHIEEMAYNEVTQWQNNTALRYIGKLTEDIGAGMAAAGIKTSWNLAASGNARVLLVENNYYQPGYTDAYSASVSVSPSENRNKYMPDAINNLLALVLGKGGEICFVPDGALEHFERVAVLQRYPV